VSGGEIRRGLLFIGRAGQEIAGELFQGELIEGHVPIEAAMTQSR